MFWLPQASRAQFSVREARARLRWRQDVGALTAQRVSALGTRTRTAPLRARPVARAPLRAATLLPRPLAPRATLTPLFAARTQRSVDDRPPTATALRILALSVVVTMVLGIAAVTRG